MFIVLSAGFMCRFRIILECFKDNNLLSRPVVEVKFEPDNDVENVQGEGVKKETLEDDDEFHITNLPSIKVFH